MTCNEGKKENQPTQNLWTSELVDKNPLIAQLVKNPPAMQETWFDSWVKEDPLEKGKGEILQFTPEYSSILVWNIPWTV